MDITSAIAYNGVTATPPAATPAAGRRGFEFDRVGISEVATDGYLDRSPLQDGLDASDVFLAGRTVRIEAAVLGTSFGQAMDDLQLVLAAYNPVLAYNADTANLGFLAFQFRQPTIDTATWTAGYIPMQFYARPTAPPTYVIRRSDLGDAARGVKIPVTISLLAKDPRKYLQTTQSVSLSASTATGTYRGDYSSWPIVTFAMSAAGSSAMQIVVDGGSVQLNLSGTTSGTYTLDYSDRTLVNASGTSYTNLITSVTQVKQMRQGAVFKVSALTGISSITMAYREAWV